MIIGNKMEVSLGDGSTEAGYTDNSVEAWKGHSKTVEYVRIMAEGVDYQ